MVLLKGGPEFTGSLERLLNHRFQALNSAIPHHDHSKMYLGMGVSINDTISRLTRGL